MSICAQIMTGQLVGTCAKRRNVGLDLWPTQASSVVIATEQILAEWCRVLYSLSTGIQTVDVHVVLFIIHRDLCMRTCCTSAVSGYVASDHKFWAAWGHTQMFKQTWTNDKLYVLWNLPGFPIHWLICGRLPQYEQYPPHINFSVQSRVPAPLSHTHSYMRFPHVPNFSSGGPSRYVNGRQSIFVDPFQRFMYLTCPEEPSHKRSIN